MSVKKCKILQQSTPALKIRGPEINEFIFFKPKSDLTILFQNPVQILFQSNILSLWSGYMQSKSKIQKIAWILIQVNTYVLPVTPNTRIIVDTLKTSI